MPGRSEKYDRLREEADKNELPYLSKSRVKTWVDNPEHYRLKYIEDIREPETPAMDRGTRIHESIEVYYENAIENVEKAAEDPVSLLPQQRKLWADFTQPYITNFFVWEMERLAVAPTLEDWSPVAVEEEHWSPPLLDINKEPEWTGLADAILNANSVPGFEDEDGVVIVDFKTGKVPPEKYRDDGIYLELTFYEMVFDDKYDVAGSVAYYPRENTMVTNDKQAKASLLIREEVEEMIELVSNVEDYEHFPTREGPLCKWGPDEDEESAYYGVCPCTWGVPINNEDEFRERVERGDRAAEIARAMDTSTSAVSYWKYKLDL